MEKAIYSLVAHDPDHMPNAREPAHFVGTPPKWDTCEIEPNPDRTPLSLNETSLGMLYSDLKAIQTRTQVALELLKTMLTKSGENQSPGS